MIPWLWKWQRHCPEEALGKGPAPCLSEQEPYCGLRNVRDPRSGVLGEHELSAVPAAELHDAFDAVKLTKLS